MSENNQKENQKRKKELIFKFLIFSSVSIGVGFYFLSLLPSKTIIIERQPTDLVNINAVNDEETSNPTTQEKKSYYLKDFTEIRNNFILNQADFLEVHLSEMELRAYKDGVLEKAVPILLKGDPQGWGGTAAGLYKIESGHKIGFSIVSDVYMPYSLSFYGKYYIHGEPYYPGGEKLVSDVSGGCLRLSDEDAEFVYETTEIGMPILVIDRENDKYEYPNEEINEFPQLSAQSYLVADLDSGFVFTEKNSKAKLPIASLTKLMTALVVAENVDLRKSISITEEMLEAYGDTEGLEAGKSFRVVELFYPLLIESSNDAAEALSYFLGKQRIVELMNEKAKSILMQNTNFSDPSGFDPKNISTAQDLFYLLRYIFNNRPPILEITKGKEVRSFGEVQFDIENLWNKNEFINDPTFVGGKTGYTPEANYTAAFIFNFNGKDDKDRNVAIILLGSEDKKTDTQKIYIWLQENYFKI
ncbi:serine hydrolase [Patescibacteria group bacterium]|nr:serine hydrolase [Patescibacteria group bacterium]